MTADWKQNIKDSQADFEHYCKKIRGFAHCPSASDLILRGEYIIWKQEQLAQQVVVEDIPGGADD